MIMQKIHKNVSENGKVKNIFKIFVKHLLDLWSLANEAHIYYFVL